MGILKPSSYIIRVQKCVFLFLCRSAACQFYKEAYICDTTRLAHRLQNNSLTSSMSDCSVAIETTTAWSKEEEEEDDDEEEEDDKVSGQLK